MGFMKLVYIAFAVVVALCLHVGVNFLNRVICELFLCEDCDRNVLNCSFLVLVVLFTVLTLQPCHFASFCRVLALGELILQLLYLFWFCNLHFLLICDIIPYLEKTWLGGFALWKILLLLLILWIIWIFFLPSFECQVKWRDCDEDATTVVSSNSSWCNQVYGSSRSKSKGGSCAPPDDDDDDCPSPDNDCPPCPPPSSPRNSGDC